jgi:hypothetical protein
MCTAATTKPTERRSPVRTVDPIVRGLNTIMYGLVVHFGSLWVMGDTAADICTKQPWWITALFLHEYWVYLQHSNVLANPFCQRLDRQYGIALLKSNQHWAIAGTLSAYWCRETLGMFLCLPFVGGVTKYLVLYSLIYHTIKSRGVRQDAIRRYSPKFGIMRVVIDNFYLHTVPETFLTCVRLLLQGLDTMIHFKIVSDLLLSFGPTMRSLMHGIFTVWVIHAAMNQFFRCSTASVMVQAWYAMTAKVKNKEASSDDDDTEAESVSSGEEEEGFVVRNLLQEGRVSDELKGSQGGATGGVDAAVRIETVVAILAAVHIIGFRDVPFRVLAMEMPTSDLIDKRLLSTIPYAWLLWSMLYGASLIILPRSQQKRKRTDSGRLRSILNILDIGMMIAGATRVSSRANLLALLLALGVTMKSFLQTAKVPWPKLMWMAISSAEFVLKASLGRCFTESSAELDVAFVSAAVSIIWGVWATSITTPCEIEGKSSESYKSADVVFLGHPAELSDCWALWSLPYSLENRWKRPFWAVLLWPLHYVVGYYVCNWRQKLFGDGASFFCCDDLSFSGVRMQTWTASHFGRHFVTHPRQVKRNIEAAARHADETGVKVLCLGALNKAESINGGGVGVVRSLGPLRRLSVIHGNHLTAAAVVETTYQCFGRNAKVFLTGASSKVGWAVARALRDRYGYDILCHSTDRTRRELFEKHGFKAASTLCEGTAFSSLWIVGKYDMAVARYIPQGATAVVFSVPHPLESRTDVRVVEAGTLHMDLSRADRPRRFTNKLKEYELFACHAASVVAAHRLKRDVLSRIDETGPVDPNEMDGWLVDAKALGFSIPHVEPVAASTIYDADRGNPPVVIIGAGPAGLAVAASLHRRNIQSIILEEQKNPDSFGSWEKHFTGLEVTTQKRWCHLPGFPMSDDLFPGENVGAQDYRRYLKLYSARFGLSMKRGVRVENITRGGETSPWIVNCGEGTKVEASAVVVATGKHRVPQRSPSDDLCAKLTTAEIPFVHSSDLRNSQTWVQATDAANVGKLCVVGFGNSAADVCTAILQSCRTSTCEGDTKIHVATRSVPPVFPRKRGFLRVDTLGYAVRWMPKFIQEPMIRLLWWGIPSSARCNSAFPSHLKRWDKINGRVPVIDKYGLICSSLQSGTMLGHGPVLDVTDEKEILFDDSRSGVGTTPVSIEMVILATGYKKECIIGREDRLNGLFLCGFGNDRLLPLKTIGEEAEAIAKELTGNF